MSEPHVPFYPRTHGLLAEGLGSSPSFYIVILYRQCVLYLYTLSTKRQAKCVLGITSKSEFEAFFIQGNNCVALVPFS